MQKQHFWGKIVGWNREREQDIFLGSGGRAPQLWRSHIRGNPVSVVGHYYWKLSFNKDKRRICAGWNLVCCDLCSKSTIETPEEGMKYILRSKLIMKIPERRHWRCSGVFIVVNFRTFFWCFYCWLWTGECLLVFISRPINENKSLSSEQYLGSCQTSIMELFAKISNG